MGDDCWSQGPWTSTAGRCGSRTVNKYIFHMDLMFTTANYTCTVTWPALPNRILVTGKAAIRHKFICITVIDDCTWGTPSEFWAAGAVKRCSSLTRTLMAGQQGGLGHLPQLDLPLQPHLRLERLNPPHHRHHQEPHRAGGEDRRAGRGKRVGECVRVRN